MKIGIIGAMEEEIQLLKKNLRVLAEEETGMRIYYSGKLFSQDIVLAFSRWGKVAAAVTAATLIQRYHVDLVLFTGVAGAVENALNIGDIIIANNLVQYDMDVSALPGFKKFEIPLLGKCSFAVEPILIDIAERSAQYYLQNEMKQQVANNLLNEFGITQPKIVVGRIASGDRFVTDSQDFKTLFLQDIMPQCVEMEGAAVAQVCYEHDVPYIVLRVISDKADVRANLDFEKFIAETASYFTAGILKQMIKEL